jgi:hypothetical protein
MSARAFALGNRFGLETVFGSASRSLSVCLEALLAFSCLSMFLLASMFPYSFVLELASGGASQ